jgi:hypothetical protein
MQLKYVVTADETRWTQRKGTSSFYKASLLEYTLRFHARDFTKAEISAADRIEYWRGERGSEEVAAEEYRLYKAGVLIAATRVSYHEHSPWDCGEECSRREGTLRKKLKVARRSATTFG